MPLPPTHEDFTLQAVQALVRTYDDAYLQNEDGADREFWVAFFSLPTSQPLRALKTGAIGHLTCFKACTTALGNQPLLEPRHIKA